MAPCLLINFDLCILDFFRTQFLSEQLHVIADFVIMDLRVVLRCLDVQVAEHL